MVTPAKVAEVRQLLAQENISQRQIALNCASAGERLARSLRESAPIIRRSFPNFRSAYFPRCAVPAAEDTFIRRAAHVASETSGHRNSLEPRHAKVIPFWPQAESNSEQVGQLDPR